MKNLPSATLTFFQSARSWSLLRRQQAWSERIQIGVMLAPALAVIVILFMGGLVLALSQSFGYLPFIGRDEGSLTAYQTIFQQAAFYRSLWLTC